ncbi:hypothetical protein LMG29739_06304 [Paraburkholderia solisilvae]|uniref:Uncharacterized protein n=1 Tax=Paraburkholderia solisilvae TaxID=624376 RepID=A0A6J5F4R5_9BURK|nr:hypothetical protein LMG29739_06304 [Paraburkholderia solisilvae]
MQGYGFAPVNGRHSTARFSGALGRGRPLHVHARANRVISAARARGIQ